MEKIQFCDPRNFTGGRCDCYLMIEGCLKRHNLKIFLSILGEIVLLRLIVDTRNYSAIKKILQVKDVTIT